MMLIYHITEVTFYIPLRKYDDVALVAKFQKTYSAQVGHLMASDVLFTLKDNFIIWHNLISVKYKIELEEQLSSIEDVRKDESLYIPEHLDYYR